MTRGGAGWVLVHVAAAVASCQPAPTGARTADDCDPSAPAPGEVRVGVVACAEMLLARGDGRIGDLYLANTAFRVVLREPEASLGLVGLGGGTLIDAAPWERSDVVYEIAPLVGGGWLDVTAMTLLEDGVRLEGTVGSLPDRVAEAAGSQVEVTWRIAPDSPWLDLVGSDGLWLHGGGSYAVIDGWLWTDTVVIGHDGGSWEDLGGALRIAEVSRLLVATPDVAMAERAGQDGTAVSGTAIGAARVVVLADGAAIGRLIPDDTGRFSGVVPAVADGLRADAGGTAFGVVVPPGQDLTLPLGAAGAVRVLPAWPGARRRPIQVDWSAADGRGGRAFLDAEGGVLALGAGAFDLTMRAGPGWEVARAAVEVGEDATVDLGIALVERFDPGLRVLAAFDRRPDRSRDWRGTDLSAALLAQGAGADWVAFTALDDVSSVGDGGIGFPATPHRNGSIAVARDGAWTITSWPWTATLTRPAHGALDVRVLSAEDALAAAVNGTPSGRHAVVDLGWLEAVGPAWTIDPRPEGVRLDAPGAEGPEAWAAWYAWLDAGAALTPVGPFAWAPVPDPSLMGEEDVEQAFTAGRLTATSGPLLTLAIGDRGPGDVLDPEDTADPPVADVSLAGGRDLDHVALVGPGGVRAQTWDLSGEDAWEVSAAVPPGAWVIAVAWNDAGSVFAATAPIWVDPP